MIWKCDRKDDDWGGYLGDEEDEGEYLNLPYLKVPRFPPLMSETTATTTTNEEDDSRIIRAMSKQGNGHTCTVCTVEYHRHIPTQQ